ncbi:hypothetical protein EI534_21910 [Pseudomonas frederiksbergensis]|nr:hypothetical protein [Pseudomonas frederiksbergensis]
MELLWSGAFVARGLAPVGVRSAPLHSFRRTVCTGFTTASQPNGGKPPRHRPLSIRSTTEPCPPAPATLYSAWQSPPPAPAATPPR